MARSFGPSAKVLVWGVATLVLGALASVWGWLSQIAEASRGYVDTDGTTALVVLGIVAALIGLVVTLAGVWQLATNVDIAALAAQEAAAQVERDQERAERSYAEAARDVEERWKNRLADESGRDD